MKKLLVLLLAFVSINAMYAQKTSLELNLKKGETYRQKLNTGVNMTMNVADFNMEMTMDTYIEMSFYVKKASSKYYEIDVTYNSMRVSLDGAGQSVTVDENSGDAMGSMLKKMIGKSFFVKMGKTGEVLEISGLEEIMNTLFDDPAYGTEAERQAVKEQFSQLFDGKSIMQQFNGALVFPAEKVAPGDTWESEIEFPTPMLGNSKMLFRYEYKGNADGMNIIAVTNTTDMNINVAPNMSMNMTGTGTGEIKVDAKTGWVSKSSMTTDVAGEMLMPEDGSMKMSMTMKADITDK